MKYSLTVITLRHLSTHPDAHIQNAFTSTVVNIIDELQRGTNIFPIGSVSQAHHKRVPVYFYFCEVKLNSH